MSTENLTPGALPQLSKEETSSHSATETNSVDEKASNGQAYQESAKDIEAAGILAEAPIVTYPEGGLQGWATVLGACCVQFCGFGYTSSFGVYQDYYARVYLTHYSSSAISWIGSTAVFIGIGGGVLSGQLFDRGHFKFTVYSGAFMISFGLFMLSLAKPGAYYQIILAQGICTGIGVGLIYVPSVVVVSHYFHQKRTLAMSIVACGAALGSIVHPIMLNNTLHSSLGFGNSVRASAGVVTAMLVLACALMRTRLPPPKVTVPIVPAMKKFARDGAYMCASLALFFVAIGFYYTLYYLQLNAALHHVDRSFAFYSLVILNACQLLGRLATAFVAQRFGAPLVIMASSGCCAAIVWGMIGIHSPTSVVLVGVFFGFFAGAYQALEAPLVAVLSDDVSEIGARMGIALSFLAVGALIGKLYFLLPFNRKDTNCPLGSPICGALLTHKYIWWKATLFASIMMLTGCAFFVASCVILRRRGKLHPKKA
ncbi:MFS general substrate transporter [Trametopsis cervina]|nr:MFS general substrate transporter [Trametopsis cervina]